MTTSPKDRLKIARETAGFPTPSAAARAFKNININTLISNENGNRDISRTMAVRYAEAFGVDPGWILYGDEYQGRQRQKDTSLQKRFHSLPDIFFEEPDNVFPKEENYLTAESRITLIPLIPWGLFILQDLSNNPSYLSDFPMIEVTDLPKGQWIALRVDDQLMNKISPYNSIILVNMSEKGLIPNAYYIVMDEMRNVVYHRYRPHEKPQFQPFSYQGIKPPKLQGNITIIGRVRRTITDM